MAIETPWLNFNLHKISGDSKDFDELISEITHNMDTVRSEEDYELWLYRLDSVQNLRKKYLKAKNKCQAE
jgi:hypothetical protein